MTDDDRPTPSLELPRPDFADGSDMAARIAWRLFPKACEEPSQSNIGGYKVLRLLGSGGMGVVHAAEDQKLGRIVALKVLRSNQMLERERRRLIDEARTLAKFSHPNVVQVYEVGQHGETVYVAMEHVRGQTLERWQSKRRSLRDLLDMYLQAGAGLVAAHAAKIIHRDFKPANVLVGDDGRARVADFGLALPSDEKAQTDRIPIADDSSQSASSRRLAGTPGYLAPELFLGRSASERSDQFSFCAALWQGIAGTTPFETAETGPVPDLRGTVKPRWLRRILLRGLAFDPRDRWPSLVELLEAIEHARRVRRAARIAVPLVFAALIPTTLVLAREPEAPSCESSGSGFEDVWNEDREDRLLALGDEASMQAVAGELDDYAKSWSTVRRDACEAHFERRDLSAEGLDLTQGCLDDLHDRARAVVDALLEGDVPSDRTDELLDSLPPPRACADFRLQRSRLPPAIAGLGRNPIRSRLDEIELALARGEYSQSRDSLATLSSESSLEGTPEHADALVLLGIAERALGNFDLARGHFKTAAIESEVAARPETRFRSLRELAELEAYDLHRVDWATEALDSAEAPLRVLGQPPHLVAQARFSSALLQATRGNHDGAETSLREALALQEQAGVVPRQREKTQLRLANSLAARGETKEALGIYQTLLEARKARLGDQHPDLGPVYFNIGLTFVELRNWNEAKPHLETALALESRSFGPSSPKVAQVLATLADVETELGNPIRAAELAERAMRIQIVRVPPGHPDRDAGRFAFAWALLSAGELERSLVAHFELLAELGLDWDQERPSLHVTIGWLLCRVGRCSEARPHAEAAKGSELAGVRVKAWLLEVEVELELGNPRAAALALERADAELVDLPEPREAQLDAEIAWLRALVAAASGDRKKFERSAGLVDTYREHLYADQIAKLDSLLD